MDLGDEDPQARAERYRHNVDALLPVLGERWEKEWLPNIIETVSRRIRQDYGAMSDADLLRTWDEMYEEVKDRWYIHGLLLYGFFAAGQFADLYKEVTGADDEKLGYEALQGFETMATRSARGLWKLSRNVRANPELQRIFEGSNPEDIMSQLDSSQAGRAFMSELDAYLDEFGWRADSVYELTHPAWREDPRIAINAIQGYLAIEDDHGPDSQLQSAIRRREELLADARAKIGNDSARLQKFNATYDSTRCFTPMVEDHNHWIDQMGDISMRYPALELGRRCVARGTLANAEDIFHLERAEIVEAMNGVDKKDAGRPAQGRPRALRPDRAAAVHRPAAAAQRRPRRRRHRALLRPARGAERGPTRDQWRRGLARHRHGKGESRALAGGGVEAAGRRRARVRDDAAAVDAAVQHRQRRGRRYGRHPVALRHRRARESHPVRRRDDDRHVR